MKKSEIETYEYEGDSPWRSKALLVKLYHSEGMNQYEIAEFLGCSRSNITQWFGRHGIDTPNPSVEERFWDKVDVGDPDECWEWTAGSSGGYGSFYLDGVYTHAHRAGYTIDVEDPGESMVLHECDNKLCVNPGHLYLGDNSDNMNDMWARTDRPAPEISGEDNFSAKLRETEVTEIKDRLQRTDETHAEIAQDYDVTPSTISMIASGVTWNND